MSAGRRRVRLERGPGSDHKVSMDLLPSGNIKNQSKLKLRVTKDQFSSPGKYEIVLTAEGPHGPKMAARELEISGR